MRRHIPQNVSWWEFWPCSPHHLALEYFHGSNLSISTYQTWVFLRINLLAAWTLEKVDSPRFSLGSRAPWGLNPGASRSRPRAWCTHLSSRHQRDPWNSIQYKNFILASFVKSFDLKRVSLTSSSHFFVSAFSMFLTRERIRFLFYPTSSSPWWGRGNCLALAWTRRSCTPSLPSPAHHVDLGQMTL